MGAHNSSHYSITDVFAQCKVLLRDIWGFDYWLYLNYNKSNEKK